MNRRVTALLALVFALSLAIVPVAAAGSSASRIDLPNGWAPEGITAGTGTTIYVGSLANGGIWQGDVATGDGDVLVLGEAGQIAVGVEFEADASRLWVAGGPTGQVRAYDAETGALLATYTFSPAGFLNDLVVTDDAVYVTDSAFGHLDVIPLDAGGALPDPAAVEMLPLSGIDVVPNEFNLNGIVASRGWLIVVQSNTGKLFRVDPATGSATEIDLGTRDVSFGDGLELNNSALYVVQNQLNRVEVFRLAEDLGSAAFRGFRQSPSLDVPTTAASIDGRLYVVNARFGTPVTPDTEYWVSRLPG